MPDLMSLARTTDRRRHQRLPVVLRGRYMLPDRTEHPCETVDISPGGLMLRCHAKPYRGQPVVAYIAEIGRIGGTATRIVKDGFAMAFPATIRKREKLTSTIMWVGNRDALGLPESRRYERIVPNATAVSVTLPSGLTVAAHIIDLSMSGIAISVAVPLPSGASVLVGARPARVVRAAEGGCALEFSFPLSPDELTPGIRFDV